MNHLKSFSLMALKAALRSLLLAGVGILVSVAGMLIAISLFGNNAGNDYHGAHSGSGIGALFGVIVLYREEFWTALLLTVSIFVPILYCTLAMKLTFSTVLHHLLQQKMLPLIEKKATGIISAILAQDVQAANLLGGVGVFRKKLMDAIDKESYSYPWFKKVLRFGFKKLSLDAINFNSPTLAQDLSAQMTNRLNEAANPSVTLFFYLFGLHFLLMLLAWFFDHT